MSITPQAIKDQEFQVKFRGYDAIEVKAYLELLAEEFFELHELRRKQEEEFAELHEENQTLKQEKNSLLAEGRQQVERSEASVQQFQEKDEIIAELEKKIIELEEKVEQSEQEKTLQQEAWERQETELREEIQQLNDRLDDEQNAVSMSTSEKEKLRTQIDLLEKQVAELKQEEIDFKATIVAAQKFADDLKVKSKEEADRMMADATEEVETFRRESEKELAHIPVEIDKLRQKKRQVKDELKTLLQAYLEQIEAVDEAAGVDTEDDLSDLFQSISLNGEEIDPVDVDKAGFE